MHTTVLPLTTGWGSFSRLHPAQAEGIRIAVLSPPPKLHQVGTIFCCTGRSEEYVQKLEQAETSWSVTAARGALRGW